MRPTCNRMSLCAVVALLATAAGGATASAAVTLDQVLDPMAAKLVVGEYHSDMVLSGDKSIHLRDSGVAIFTSWVVLRLESVTGNENHLFARTEISARSKMDAMVAVEFIIHDGVDPIWMTEMVVYNVCGDYDETCSETSVEFYRTKVHDYVDMSEPDNLFVDVMGSLLTRSAA